MTLRRLTKSRGRESNSAVLVRAALPRPPRGGNARHAATESTKALRELLAAGGSRPTGTEIIRDILAKREEQEAKDTLEKARSLEEADWVNAHGPILRVVADDANPRGDLDAVLARLHVPFDETRDHDVARAPHVLRELQWIETSLKCHAICRGGRP